MGFLSRASSGRGWGRMGRLQEAGEDGTAGMRSREPDPDSANRLLNDRSDLEQSESERVELSSSERLRHATYVLPEGEHQAVGRHVEVQPETVGQVARAGEPIG